MHHLICNFYFCMSKFLFQKAGDNCQIVSLGAGFDTLYWRLRDEGYKFSNYTEVDFPTVTAKKCFCIKRSKDLLETIGTPGMLFY